MNVTRKDATITNVGNDDDFPGSFEVILSTPEKDRDGEELATADWKMPLPDHITFDNDHGMSVEKTVGSGVPRIEGADIVVSGTYSSLLRAQETRTLVKEGHIRTVSVAFMSEKVTKGGQSRTVRELLNGAFVAIPSNRGARVLASKAGARNSRSDQQNIQTAHDALVSAGADCGPMDDTGAAEGATGGKSVTDAELKGKYSAEQLRTMLSNGEAMKNPQGDPSYPLGDKEDLQNAIHAVGRGSGDHSAIRAYIIRRAKALGASDMIPADWTAGKAYTPGKPGHDPASLAQGIDAALDEALALLVGVDQSTLPEPVAQALGLLNAAAMGIDELLEVMGVDDPDDVTEETTSAEKSVADALVKNQETTPSPDTDALALKYQAIQIASLVG